MKKHIYFISIITLIFAAIIIKFIYLKTELNLSNIKDGYIYIDNFNTKEKLTLNGEWEIYENMLIIDENIDIDSINKQLISLPSKPQIRNHRINRLSYRVVLDNIPKDKDYMVILDGITGGYALYINRELIYSNHKLNIDGEGIKLPEEKDFYYNDVGSIEIIIEVSKFDFEFFGIVNAPQLAAKKFYNKTLLIDTIFNFLIAGGIVFALIYYVLVIAIRTNERSAIWFALLCLSIFTYYITYKSSYAFVMEKILNIYDGDNFYFRTLSLYISSLLVYLSIKAEIKAKKNNILDYIIIILAIFTFITPLFMQELVLINNLYIFDTLNVITLLCIGFWSIKHIKQNVYNMYFTIIIFLLAIGNSIDILITYNILPYFGRTVHLIFYFSTFIFISINASNYEDQLSNVQEIMALNQKIRDTEFTFLNTQIQSHFIYNTLNAIQSLCYSNPEKAGELIDDFSMYLRTRLEFNKMPILIDFEDELENIRTYINIEKQRFGSRINVEYSIKAGDFKVPPLTIQPLVENAIKHGIVKKRLGGTVTIATDEDDNFIYVVVTDDGVGFDHKKLTSKQRVGTQNIKHRLSLHLNATIEINSTINKGTKAIIKIPKKK